MALVVLAVACGPAPIPTPATKSLYPLQLGQHWVYDTQVYGVSPRATTSTVAVCRIRLDEDGDLLHLVATCADDEIVQAQFVYQLGSEIVEPLVFNSAGEAQPRSPPVVIARLDMAVGQQWRWRGRTPDDQERSDLYRVTNRGRVVTAAGEFEALRLLVQQENTGTAAAAVERWYAPGVGLVKEAGAAVFPIEPGRLAQIELVRTLREQGIRPVGQIPCCGLLPAGDE